MYLESGRIFITRNLQEMVGKTGQQEVAESVARWVLGTIEQLKGLSDIERAHKLYRTADGVISNKQAAEESICKRGCHHCCYQFVALSHAEMALIKDFIKRRGIKVGYKKIKWQSKFRNPDEYWKQYGDRTRCVFLNENNDCAIYPVRPLSCRTYFSGEEDPSLCTPGEEGSPQRIRIIAIPEVEVLISALANLEHSDSMSDGGQMFSSLPRLLLNLKKNHEI